MPEVRPAELLARLMGAWLAAVAAAAALVAWRVLDGEPTREAAGLALGLWLASPLGYGLLGYAVAREVGGRFALGRPAAALLSALPLLNSWTLCVVLGEYAPRARRALLASPLAAVAGLLSAAFACFGCHLVSPEAARGLSALAVILAAVVPAAVRAVTLARLRPSRAGARFRARRCAPVAG